MTRTDFTKKRKNIPDAPGVYFFLGKRREVLYIGKATSLRSRLASYFSSDLGTTRGPLLVDMLARANTIDWRKTDSVLEALILEANLIRTHKPRYNSIQKDDKSFNYVVITKEEFPRVLLMRGKELHGQEAPGKSFSHTFGPFPHGLQLKEALRIIRKIFPYRDTCVPAPEMIASGKKPKACFNRHIGLCPGVCSGDISKADYRRIIRRITLLFQGKKNELMRAIARDMRAASKEERFEDAAQLRGQLFALNHIQDVSLIKDEYRRPNGDAESRIEAYDVAHLGGSNAVGVMVVVENGFAQKGEYRKFRIRGAKGGDDAGALREILSRRFGHDEWPLPRLLAVDGAAIQMRTAQAVLAEHALHIPVVGVVKDEKHRPRAVLGDKTLLAGREKAILLANAEAHRFAIGYHRATRRLRSGKDA